MALATPTISVQNGTAAAAVNASAGAAVFVDAGAYVTFALQSSTGVQQCVFTVGPSTAGAGTGAQTNSVSPTIAASPFSWSTQMPNYPCQFLLVTEVTDGFNITTNTNLIVVGQPAGKTAGLGHRARNVLLTNVANLASYAVASAAGNDNVSGGNVQGDYVLAVNQTTGSQNGLYVVGVVGGGNAPLTRVPDFATGAVLQQGQQCDIAEGTLWLNSTWKITTVGAITVDTTSHVWFPRIQMGSGATGGGTTIALSTLWALSASNTHIFTQNRTAANASFIGTITVGAGGTGSATITGTTANTYDWILVNW